MKRIGTTVRQRPLGAFFVLAYAFAWILSALTSVSVVFGFLALFGPAAAALVVAMCENGREGARALLERATIWQVRWRWYLIALGLPAALSLVAAWLSVALGAAAQVRFSDVSALSLILFVLVIGEELGWRGFALPRLQARYGALGASLILGALWAAWHLPNQLIPGLEFYGYGFPAFALYVLPMSVLFTWIASHTRASVLLAWLFHGAINSLIFINDAVDIVQRWWLSAAVYGAFALLVVLVSGSQLTGRRQTTTHAAAKASIGR